VFRYATAEDVGPLADLERAANEVGLAHVFPAERYPFPMDDVIARWALVLADPAVKVLVVDADEDSGDAGLLAYAAYDDSSLRHVAVRPDQWGHGLASTAIEAAVQAIKRRGATIASLWVLEENGRARRLYEYLGWRATEERRPAPWPPYPTELRHTRLTVQSHR
jgi:GNAT superfamily N-acetyltransferase